MMKSKTASKDIGKLMQQVRDLVNDTYMQNHLIAKLDKWHVICSAMDIIEDTNLAINTYLKIDIDKSSEDWLDNCGNMYLYIYGILQALYIQQDAVHFFLKKLELDDIWQEYAEKLDEIRQIRNNATGHPVYRNRTRTSNFISRSEMSLKGFTLLIYSSKESMKFEQVDLHKLITTQNKSITSCLSKIVLELKKTINDHRRKYMLDELREIFKDSSWLFSNIHEAAMNTKPTVIGNVALKCLQESVDLFINKVVEREAIILDREWKKELSEIKQLFKRISDGINGGDYDSLTLTSYIEYLEKKIDGLEEQAKDIDEDFKKKV